MASWTILSCAVSKFFDAILLAGIIRQYSKNAIPQLIKIIKKRGVELLLYLRLPYQANVIKTFEATKRTKGQYLLTIDILNYSLVYISFTLWYFYKYIILVFFAQYQLLALHYVYEIDTIKIIPQSFLRFNTYEIMAMNTNER